MPSEISQNPLSLYRRAGKRLADVVGASLLGLLALPVAAVIAVLIRSTMGRPVLFRQQRPGLGGIAFVILKFRTMTMERDAKGEPLPDGERITPLGGCLRRWSLDELPELWNVLRGDMSLVGPRPLRMSYLEKYSPEQARRHEVRPGITGWAQVRGRNALNWDEKLHHDVWYVDHLSPGLDLRILAATARMVFSGEGISAAGHATMPEFRGRGDEQGERQGD